MASPLKKLALGGLGASLGLYLLAKTQTDDVPRDVGFLFTQLKTLRRIKELHKAPVWGVVDLFYEQLHKHPKKPCLRYVTDDNRVLDLNWQEVDEKSNQVANFLRSKGCQPGQVVALMMENRLEYTVAWLGATKIGCTAALINNNLIGRSLIHCLGISKASFIIVSADHAEQVHTAREEVKSNPKDYAEVLEPVFTTDQWYVYCGQHPAYIHLDPLLAQQPTNLPGGLHPTRTANDTLFYIYTSGTTGLPKASIITHLKFAASGLAFANALNVRPDDIYYCPLPLYHASASMLALGVAWTRGMTFSFRKKFSATQFWNDCLITDSTVIQYIGELCAYLLSKPPGPADTRHKIRLAIGNGLRPDLWPPFQTRFKIEQIGEFYGATEGIVAFLNTHNKSGAVGFVPPLISKLSPAVIVKYNIEKDEIERNANGWCIVCEEGEAGHLIGKIDRSMPIQDFKGYTNKAASQKKIIKNVFIQGDEYFMTGDLLKSIGGYYYFVDRIGDTFRWKGENVATSEVELVLRTFKNITDVNVYGVQVPGQGGRAGMAALVGTDLDMEAIYAKCVKELPSYAVPVFLRLRPQLEVTGTFKHTKGDLQREGFDPTTIPEPLYVKDDKKKAYVPLDKALYQQIVSEGGQAKL